MPPPAYKTEGASAYGSGGTGLNLSYYGACSVAARGRRGRRAWLVRLWRVRVSGIRGFVSWFTVRCHGWGS